MMVNLFKEAPSLWKKHAYLCKIHFSWTVRTPQFFFKREMDRQKQREIITYSNVFSNTIDALIF